MVGNTVGPWQGSVKWAGIQAILATLRTRLAVLTAHQHISPPGVPTASQSHQCSWQPPMHWHRPGPHSLRPISSRLSQPRCPTRPVNPKADFTGLGAHAADPAALDHFVEQAAVRIQRAFRHFHSAMPQLPRHHRRSHPATDNVHPAGGCGSSSSTPWKAPTLCVPGCHPLTGSSLPSAYPQVSSHCYGLTAHTPIFGRLDAQQNAGDYSASQPDWPSMNTGDVRDSWAYTVTQGLHGWHRT